MPFSSSSFLEDFLKSREGLVGGLESNSASQVSKEVVPAKQQIKMLTGFNLLKKWFNKDKLIFIPFSNRNLQGPLSGRIVTWRSGFLPTRKKEWCFETWQPSLPLMSFWRWQWCTMLPNTKAIWIPVVSEYRPITVNKLKNQSQWSLIFGLGFFDCLNSKDLQYICFLVCVGFLPYFSKGQFGDGFIARSYCWWFRHPGNDLGCIINPIINYGINNKLPTYQLVQARFLNHSRDLFSVEELEAGLFLQLDDTWTMDCNKEDVEDGWYGVIRMGGVQRWLEKGGMTSNNHGTGRVGRYYGTICLQVTQISLDSTFQTSRQVSGAVGECGSMTRVWNWLTVRTPCMFGAAKDACALRPGAVVFSGYDLGWWGWDFIFGRFEWDFFWGMMKQCMPLE